MRIKDYLKRVFRVGLRDNEGIDASGFPLHDESRPHLHIIAYGKRSIEYLSDEAVKKLEQDIYEIPARARAAGL